MLLLFSQNVYDGLSAGNIEVMYLLIAAPVIPHPTTSILGDMIERIYDFLLFRVLVAIKVPNFEIEIQDCRTDQHQKRQKRVWNKKS